MNLQRHNFGKLGKLTSDLDQRVTAWLKAALALAARNWQKTLPFELALTYAALDIARPGDALEQLPETIVTYRVTLDNGTTTLLCFPRLVVATIVAGLLGDVTGPPSEDRELSVVEESLWQYFLQDFLLQAMQETCTGIVPLTLTLEEREANAQWSRAFQGSGNLVVCGFAAAGPFGNESCRWLVPIKAMLALFGVTKRQPGEPSPEPVVASPLVESLVESLPVEIAVSLGSAEISLMQMTRLSVGDMVILDQRVSEPLTASLGGGPKLLGWAGRVGMHLAFKIEDLQEIA